MVFSFIKYPCNPLFSIDVVLLFSSIFNKAQINKQQSLNIPPIHTKAIMYQGYSSLISICILIRILLKFVPNGAIDNESAMVQVMVWRRTGDNEPMLTHFTDTHMQN